MASVLGKWAQASWGMAAALYVAMWFAISVLSGLCCLLAQMMGIVIIIIMMT